MDAELLLVTLVDPRPRASGLGSEVVFFCC